MLLYLLDVLFMLRLTQLPLRGTESVPSRCRLSRYTLVSIERHAYIFAQSALMHCHKPKNLHRRLDPTCCEQMDELFLCPEMDWWAVQHALLPPAPSHHDPG